MFSIFIQGGLGNQMFQIFAALSYSINYCKKLVLPAKLQNWDKRITYWNNIFDNLKPLLITNEDIGFKEIKEPGFHFSEIPNINENFILNGYFQSYKYFEKNYKEICNTMSLYEKRNIIKDKFYNYENTISLHFRMGDYKQCTTHHPITPDIFYIKSLQYIIDNTKQKKWTILYTCEKEDDIFALVRIANIKNNFKYLNFIKVDNKLEDWEQMMLMSLCNHNIISNSTFSWWSAYINDFENKIVCYPSIWFGVALSNTNVKDLHPKSWIKIDI